MGKEACFNVSQVGSRVFAKTSLLAAGVSAVAEVLTQRLPLVRISGT